MNLTCKVTINLTAKFIVDLVTFAVTLTITFAIRLISRTPDFASDFGFAPAALEAVLDHAGVLRVLSNDPGISQQELTRLLSIIPTRAVALVKELERRGLVERRWNPDDFRAYVLHLTERGKQMLASVEQIARIHNEQICEGLDNNERRQLASLLSFIAVRLGQTPGVDAGYRRIARGGPTRKQVAGLTKLRKSSSGGAVS